MRRISRELLSGASLAARQAVFPPDPGSLRLLGAARATLGGCLALLLALLLRPLMPMPFTARVMGFAVAMFLGATVRDPTRREQAWTIALSPVPVVATAFLVALALPVPYLPAALTVALVFLAICAASLGPRWATLGVVSLIGLLVALLSRLTFADLPSRAVVIVLGAACAGVVRFVILPERPEAELHRLLHVVREAIAAILASIEQAVRHGGFHPGGRRALRRMALRQNEAVMLAQPRLAAGPGMHLLELQLLTERLVRVAASDWGTDAERPVLLAQLAGLRRAFADDVPPPPPGQPASKLGRVLATLARLLDEIRGDLPLTAIAARPAPPASWAGLQIRPGVQAALATALAIAGGELVSPSRWYWAVFAAFVLFQGTRSRGESVAKAWQMMLGTLAGVLAGVLLATVLGGHVLLSMAAVVAAVFLALFASTAAYGVMTFWITIILGLVFGMLGYFPPELLLLRLKETAVGAAAGIVIAWVVLARRTPDLVRASAAAFLRAMGAVIEAATRTLRGMPGDEQVAALTLAQEQRYQALRAVATPGLPGARWFRQDRLQRLLVLLDACEEWARDLARMSLHREPQSDPTLRAIVTQADARIAASIADLAAILEGKPASAEHPHEEPAGIPASLEGDGMTLHTIRLLLRLDAALLHVRQRIGA